MPCGLSRRLNNASARGGVSPAHPVARYRRGAAPPAGVERPRDHDRQSQSVHAAGKRDRAGLTTLFDALISTDANHTYKPDPRAYQLGVAHLRVAKEDIVFAAFGGWGAAGAKSFGYPTVWVNRFNQPAEELGFDRIEPPPTSKGSLISC